MFSTSFFLILGSAGIIGLDLSMISCRVSNWAFLQPVALSVRQNMALFLLSMHLNHCEFWLANHRDIFTPVPMCALHKSEQISFQTPSAVGVWPPEDPNGSLRFFLVYLELQEHDFPNKDQSAIQNLTQIGFNSFNDKIFSGRYISFSWKPINRALNGKPV